MTTRRTILKNAFMSSLALPFPTILFSQKGTKSMDPKELIKAKIPSSGEALLRVGLGTYKTFDVAPGSSEMKGLREVLRIFLEAGGSLIDSSPMYGAAEARVGDLAKDLKVNSQLFMATKVWTTGRNEGIREMGQSLSLMGRKTMDLMQIHNIVDWRSHLPTLRQWKEEGRIRYIGISHYTPSAFAEMERIVKKEPMDFIQIPYSIAATEGAKSLIPLAADRGLAVIANEPFAKGSLFRRVKGKSPPAWAQEIGIQSWAQYFLKFIFASPEVQFAIPATNKVEHIKDNMQAAVGLLPNAEQKERMRREFAAL